MDLLKLLLLSSIAFISPSGIAMDDASEEPETIQQPTTPRGDTAVLGFVDDTLYSGNTNISFNLNGSTLSDSINVTNVRDIRLSFNGKYYYRTDLSKLNGVDIFINGVKRINFNTIQYFSNPSQLFFKKHSFLLNRNWLQSGDNEILIQNAGPFSNLGMETTNVRMDYNDPVQIKSGEKITKLYGHRIGTKSHLTGLRVEFASPSSDINFSVTGYDIDSATEVAVFLNQQRIGYLKQGNSNAFNQGDVFTLKQQDFVSSGVNTIEFIQTSSSSSERWGVTNLELGNQQSKLSGALMLLLDD